ncbi:alkJ, partial [Symbiodinium pilosum]
QTIFMSRHCQSLYPRIMLAKLEEFFERWTPDVRSSIMFNRFADLAVWWGRLFEESESANQALCNNWKIGCILNQPQSRGFIKLQSSNPHVPPLVNPNYLADDADVDTLVLAVRQAVRIFDAPPLDSLLRSGPSACLAAQSDEGSIAEFVRKNAKTTWHYSCTTRMGPVGDPKCVCDTRGHVQGVANLRVADAGLMPEIVSANINAACVMIGD